MKMKILGWLVGLSMLLTSCGLRTRGRLPILEVWLESPLPDAGEIGIPLGQSLPIYGHAQVVSDRTLQQVLLYINGTPTIDLHIQREGENLYSASGSWTPVAEGTYKLKLHALTTEGNQADSKEVRVKVTAAPMIFITPTSTSIATLPVLLTLTSTPSPTPTATIPFTSTPTATLLPTKAPTATPWPPVLVDFWADRTTLVKGECTKLHWQVQYAANVLLNNKKVAASGELKVCPSETSGYDLLASAPSGDVLRELTITVTIPQDTTPPPIPTPLQPGNSSSNNPPTINCMPLQWTAVTDPSGVTYQVELERKVGNVWQKQAVWIGVSGTTQDMGKQCTSGHYYRWHVLAKDGAGNMSNFSIWFYFNTPIL